mmetsp:Transcript_48868/g.144424  ORF Transcript_48868/g.144424 Transcript_48868/m.144424 type:complete len:246 (-) Transcript_48868:206-943(-)|eukprot:3913367-Prymnesium_polylepis.2
MPKRIAQALVVDALRAVYVAKECLNSPVAPEADAGDEEVVVEDIHVAAVVDAKVDRQASTGHARVEKPTWIEAIVLRVAAYYSVDGIERPAKSRFKGTLPPAKPVPIVQSMCTHKLEEVVTDGRPKEGVLVESKEVGITERGDIIPDPHREEADHVSVADRDLSAEPPATRAAARIHARGQLEVVRWEPKETCLIVAQSEHAALLGLRDIASVEEDDVITRRCVVVSVQQFDALPQETQRIGVVG